MKYDSLGIRKDSSVCNTAYAYARELLEMEPATGHDINVHPGSSQRPFG
jgi:hypothetical protein